jgi:hypothetical protein
MSAIEQLTIVWEHAFFWAWSRVYLSTRNVAWPRRIRFRPPLAGRAHCSSESELLQLATGWQVCGLRQRYLRQGLAREEREARAVVSARKEVCEAGVSTAVSGTSHTPPTP